MNLLKLPDGLPAPQLALLEQTLFEENMQRSKLFAKLVLFFELVLIGMKVAASVTGENAAPLVDFYLMMYMLLTVLCLFLLLFIHSFERKKEIPEAVNEWYQKGLIAVVVLFIVWGGAVTLHDQLHYGHVMAFAVNFMCVSVLFHASHKMIIKVYIFPVLFVYTGLPFYQSSAAVLTGHYINLTVFLFFCWLTSRMLYTSSYTNFYSKWLLEETNKDLESQMKQNESVNRQLEAANQQLQSLMGTDELTKIPNRRAFGLFLEKEAVRWPENRPAAFMMIDIDYFKRYNDCYGHLKGDAVIKAVAQAIAGQVTGESCFAARYGGEEFVVVMCGKDFTDAQKAAEAIRAAVYKLGIKHEGSSASPFVTVSIGLEQGSSMEETRCHLLRADQALYQAKVQGRNQVMVWEKALDTV